jgi:hypothetical protein
MKKRIDTLKNFQPKEFLGSLPKKFENHALTVMIIVAGILIGVSLYSVNSLTTTASKQDSSTSGNTPSPVSSLGVPEDTENTLLELVKDEDVSISSNIATYRRSAFSNATAESDWVITAAEALEEYFLQNTYYPPETELPTVLRNAAISLSDESDRTVNSQGSNYSYTAESCENGQCKGFLLSANVNGSIYQLGETDFTKRAWLIATAEALDAFRKSSDSLLYPNEDDVISSLNTFYEETLGSDFLTTDPSGSELNEEDSDYNYRGIDCSLTGCSAYVLRTTFKDGALYFQQSQ